MIGALFLNETIKILLVYFMVAHHKMTPYHLQENGIVDVFNKILGHALKKICNVGRKEWDD